jgi:uncharacterized protein YndB with AHSA1/START domain
MNDSTRSARARTRLERRYEAKVEELWELWTTKDGFESWWGPKGFRVEVHELEARAGGALVYDMIAVGADEIAFMKKANMPISHGTRGTFVEVVTNRSLEIAHVIVFLPGVTPYENRIRAEFLQEGNTARMIISIEAHPSEDFSKMAVAGMESQLTKVEEALASRR